MSDHSTGEGTNGKDVLRKGATLARSKRVGALGAVVLFSLGCASTPQDDGNSSSGGSSGGSPGGAQEAPGFDTDETRPSPEKDGCTESARLVYVVSQESDLYSFTPNEGVFTKIGHLDCPATNGASPNSMAVDRKDTAWVNYDDGSLYKVSTADASCAATTFERNQAGFSTFGMAFASNGAGSTEETLYISSVPSDGSEGPYGLGKIDLETLKVTMIGNYSGLLAGETAELTGTGDGRLYGFFTTSPNATFAEIDKETAKTSRDRLLAGVNTGLAWAFSFWGGDFWFYTSDGVHGSRVTQLKASGNGALEVVKTDVGGFRIVGAGVSTCAPTTPPK